MAAPYIYTSSGGSVGGDLVTRAPLYLSGRQWYCHYGTGEDAAGTRGLERNRPLKTVAQAVTNGAAGDLITFLSGHEETLTAAQTLGKARMRLQSEGEGSTRAKFTCGGTVAMFDITAAGVELDNLYFPASTAVATARVRIATPWTKVRNCYFECGPSDTAAALRYVTGAGSARVNNCEFVSSAIAVASQPSIGIEVVNALTDMELEAVIFNGGTYGWSDFAFKGTAAITGLSAIDISLLGDSDFYLATGSSYVFHPENYSGSARIELTA